MCDNSEVSEFSFVSCSSRLQLDINKLQFSRDAEVEIGSDCDISKVCTL